MQCMFHFSVEHGNCAFFMPGPNFPPATPMSDLQVLHNKAARIILDIDYRSSASAALVKLSWKKY